MVVPKPGSGLTQEEVLAHAKKQLADFKLPKKLFLSDTVPRTATGKIQRRIVAQHFVSSDSKPTTNGTSSSSSCGASSGPPAALTAPVDGYLLVAKALYAAGVRYMFGVVGIPVTRLGPCAQEVGIRFISFRNEQAAAYGASAVGYLTGRPAGLLTVSGPGVVHGLAGLSNARINTWPLVMLSGSTCTGNVGKGGFQVGREGQEEEGGREEGGRSQPPPSLPSSVWARQGRRLFHHVSDPPTCLPASLSCCCCACLSVPYSRSWTSCRPPALTPRPRYAPAASRPSRASSARPSARRSRAGPGACTSTCPPTCSTRR